MTTREVDDAATANLIESQAAEIAELQTSEAAAWGEVERLRLRLETVENPLLVRYHALVDKKFIEGTSEKDFQDGLTAEEAAEMEALGKAIDLKTSAEEWLFSCNLIRSQTQEIERLQAENKALGFWKCESCGCRFETLLNLPDTLLETMQEGVTRCSKCVELEYCKTRLEASEAVCEAAAQVKDWGMSFPNAQVYGVFRRLEAWKAGK